MTGAGPTAGYALALAALLYVPVGLFAPKGEVPLLALSALILLLPSGRVERIKLALRAPLAGLLALLLGWASLSAFWAIAPLGALALVLRLTLLFLGGLLLIDAAGRLSPAARAIVDRGFLAGAILGLGLVAIELLFGMPLRSAYEGIDKDPEIYASFWMNRGMTALALFAWPAAAVPWRHGRRLAAGGILVVSLGLVAIGPQRTAVAAVAAAILAGGLGLLLRERAAVILAVVTAAGCLAAPLIPSLLPDPAQLEKTQPELPFSLVHRLYIWNFAVERIAERPLLGWGFDSSRDIPGGQDLLPGRPPDQPAQRLPLHPHNGALQVWLELGFPGAMLLAALVAYACLATRPLAAEPMLFAAALATITTALVIAFASYGIWQTQWLAVLSMAAASVVTATGRVTEGNGVPCRKT